jgi:hypothetical protein
MMAPMTAPAAPAATSLSEQPVCIVAMAAKIDNRAILIGFIYFIKVLLPIK